METGDLISRSALIAEYDRVHIGPPGGARKLMEEAAAVEAVEVVRCWDCEHWTCMEDGFGDCTNKRFHIDGCPAPSMNADDFCSCGERRRKE